MHFLLFMNALILSIVCEVAYPMIKYSLWTSWLLGWSEASSNRHGTLWHCLGISSAVTRRARKPTRHCHGQLGYTWPWPTAPKEGFQFLQRAPCLLSLLWDMVAECHLHATMITRSRLPLLVILLTTDALRVCVTTLRTL